MDFDTIFNKIGKPVFGKTLNVSQKNGIKRIVAMWTSFNIDQDAMLAYVLETARWETGGRMQPVIETFAKTRKQAATRLEIAWLAGKLPSVKNPYWRLQNGHHWVGVGDVQLTHERNYKGKMRAAVLARFSGQDIHAKPDLLLHPQVSAFVLVYGMLNGLFAGPKLSDYFPQNDSHIDFLGARAIVNRKDRKSVQPMADNAEKWLSAIKEARTADGAEPTKTQAFEKAKKATVEKPREVFFVQEKLHALGYWEVGKPDGKVGPRTEAAVLAFKNDNGLDTSNTAMDDTFFAALARAKPRNESAGRERATVNDLREAGSRTVATADGGQAAGGVAVAVGGVAAATEALDTVERGNGILERVTALLEPFKGFVETYAIWILLGAGLVFCWQAYRIKQLRLEDHRSGRNSAR